MRKQALCLSVGVSDFSAKCQRRRNTSGHGANDNTAPDNYSSRAVAPEARANKILPAHTPCSVKDTEIYCRPRMY